MSKPNDEEVPLLVKFIINIVITFGLSLSVYFLLANAFLTFHKLSTYPYTDVSSEQNELATYTDSHENNYYDCSKGILSVEECDLINRYHHNYMNFFKLKLFDIQNSMITKQGQSLKVNTSLFTY